MPPKRKPVVEEEEIQPTWHLRPGKGRGGKRQSWAGNATRQDAPARREPPRPWEPGLRDFPPLAVIYEASPAYAVGPPPDRAGL